MLAMFGFAVIKGYLVPGPTHADVKAQRDRALDLVYEMAQELRPDVATPPKRSRGGSGSGGGQGG